MALHIETFDNARGGNTLYKALTHPAAARLARSLLDELADHGPVAIFDPGGAVEAFDAIFDMERIEIAGTYVQQVARLDNPVLGCPAQPLTELARCRARAVFVAAFDAERMLAQIRAFLPDGAKVFSLDAMRIPADRLTNRRSYLDPLNFATNFAFFRDAAGLHTQLVTVNYWSGYGAGQITCWLNGVSAASLARAQSFSTVGKYASGFNSTDFVASCFCTSWVPPGTMWSNTRSIYSTKLL